MKPCEWCGYDFEHNIATCKALIAEKKEKPISHKKGPRTNPKCGRIKISPENMEKLIEYLGRKS